MLVPSPSRAVRDSAESSRSSASSRSAPHAITFDSIGSYVAAHHRPDRDARVDPDALARRLGEHQDLPAGGQEPARGVLGVDPGLDRVPGRRDVVLRDGQRLTGGDPQLPLDEIQPGDQLGDRVLDLQPGVHLHEEELVGLGRPTR